MQAGRTAVDNAKDAWYINTRSNVNNTVDYSAMPGSKTIGSARHGVVVRAARVEEDEEQKSRASTFESVISGEDVNDRSSNTVFGAAALIIGSTIGAGILALPDITKTAGFVPSACGLVGIWTFLVGQAFLLAEVNIRLMEQENKSEERKKDTILTLRVMAERTLGPAGKGVTWIYLGLSYCLLVAYLSKFADIFGFLSDGALSSSTVATTCVLLTVALFGIGGPSAPDKLNQGLTSVLMVFFLSMLGLGMSNTDLTGLLTNPVSIENWQALGPAIPIIFLSLVYHDLIPLICYYLDGDRARTRLALLVGSIVPLLMFISWEAVALSISGDPTEEGNLVSMLMQTSGNPLIAYLVQSFSFVAVGTSFLGTTMGVSETIRAEMSSFSKGITNKLLSSQEFEEISTVEDDISNDTVDRGVALTLTLVPPLLFNSGDPSVFLSVLSFAGGYGMTFLYGVLPPLMAASLRKRKTNSNRYVFLPGGNAALGALLLGACGLILIKSS
eukprot:jgi/Picsp_1/3659/NSC_06496-R1_tyrosine-specific transport